VLNSSGTKIGVSDAKLVVTGSASQIEAENFASQSGVQAESCSEGGQDLAYIENNDYAVYNNINLSSNVTGFQARVASGGSGGSIEIRLDSITGPLVGKCDVAATGGWQSWTDVNCSISSVSGIHNVYLKFTGGSGYLFNINWFKFIKESVAPTLVGDLNGDKNVDVTDYALMKKYLLGLIDDFPVKNYLTAGDLNADGVINALDFAIFKKFLLGDISKLPYKN